MSEMQTIQWFPGHMTKTKRQIQSSLKLVDAVAEIIDARIPVSSRNPDLAKLVQNKPRVILLNKCDMANQTATKMWIDYFKKQNLVAIPVDCKSGRGLDKFAPAVNTVMSHKIARLKEKGMVNPTIRIMIVGIPNVGKSTFINRLANRSAAKVGNRPGVTTQKQWIRVNDEIELLDTPGMLWPRLDDEGVSMHLAFANSIGQNALDTEEVAFYLLKYLVLNYKNRVEKRYDVIIDLDLNADELDLNQQLVEIRDNIAIKKGAILSGGRINVQKVSDMIINDFSEGKLGRITIEKASL